MWVKTYESFMYEGDKPSKEVNNLEKILKLPLNSGVFIDVMYDDKNKDLVITQPNNISAMDAGSIIASINREKTIIKKTYNGIKRIIIGDLQIKV